MATSDMVREVMDTSAACPVGDIEVSLGEALQTAITPAGDTSRKRMVRVRSSLIEQMIRHFDVRSADNASSALGISRNTWVKLRKGEPILASVAERLVERVERKIEKVPSARSS